MKPNTNFGNLSQMIFKPGLPVFVPCAGFFLTIHHAAIKKAANPISTFWENFTMMPAFVATGPTNSEAAVTDAVVSNVPPSQAPPTISGIPNVLMIHG